MKDVNGTRVNGKRGMYISNMTINRITWDFIQRHRDEDVRKLALRGCKDPDVDFPFALQQIQGRQKAKDKLRAITKRNRGRNDRQIMAEVKGFMRGWLNYYAIADMKTMMQEWDGWLRRRMRMYIWKQWKKPRTRYNNLVKLGIPEYYAGMTAMSRRGYWFVAKTGALVRAISNERLVKAGYYELSSAYESIRNACVERAVYRTVCTVR